MAGDDQSGAGSLGAFLSALRSLPLWLLAGLALAGWVVMWFLLAAPIASVDVASFRQEWGVWIGIATLGFSGLALARAADIAVVKYLSWARARDARRTLRLIPLSRHSWWNLAKQRDDSFITQIRLKCQLANVGDRPLKIVKVHLIKPHAEEIRAEALLPAEGSPYHSPDHVVPPRHSLPASIDLMMRAALGTQGKPLRITLGLLDQFGEEYILRLVVRSNDLLPPPLSIANRLRIAQEYARALLQRLGMISPSPPPPIPPMPWTFEAGGKYLAACDAILREEKRSYGARGRTVGQFGSLNVGIQSEPNFGQTKEGEVPELLWDKSNAKQLSSPNLDRLLALRQSLATAEGANLESYLLSNLRKDSEFADVAYFVFLALHRMGRMIDALQTARTFLSGDRVFGYSNVLGVLSALVSHEHFDIEEDVYDGLESALSGDRESDFRLREKINLARLHRLDGAHASQARPAGQET